MTAVLAAGAARRMRGADKLLEPVGGRPLLRVVAEHAIRAGWPVIVTLPPGAAARRAALAGLDLRALEVPDAPSGMAASFRALAGAVPGALLVVLADMPEIEAPDLAALIATHLRDPSRVVRAADEGGCPGQPVLFPARLVPAMAGLAGDEGARRLLTGEDVATVPLPGRRATTDLDTPEDWAAWRARTGL